VRLREKIRSEGPISFRDWMAAALYDPQEGYYCRRERVRWGRNGDYRTNPERSPLFAATFADYFARLYKELGAPARWTIFEAGAGAGHFARGVLGCLERDYENVFQATRYVIDEASDDARHSAGKRLSRFGERVSFRRLSELERPLDAGIVFSNELLDAFPVHRVMMRGGRLKELFVKLDAADKFTWTAQDAKTPRLSEYFEKAGVQLREGHLAEVNLEMEDWLEAVSERLTRGFIVTVDYGAEALELYTAAHRREGSLRAFRRHQFAEDVLADPGEQDLTTTIDWTHLRRYGEQLGWSTILFERQDRFLLDQGILDQLERLTASLPGEADALALSTSLREMILPEGMGTSFQVLVQKR
jgi:SAM-dependent MidA family methyltransferase